MQARRLSGSEARPAQARTAKGLRPRAQAVLRGAVVAADLPTRQFVDIRSNLVPGHQVKEGAASQSGQDPGEGEENAHVSGLHTHGVERRHL
jgi:hypothetical protein